MKIPGINTERLGAVFSIKSKIQQSNDCFTVKGIANRTKVNRVAIISGKKKLGKSAVYRNRADRRIRAAVRTVYPELKLKGYDFIFHLQPLVITAPWTYVLDKVASSFKSLEDQARITKQKFGKK
ncbi:hypothetical protein BDF20DRAFT_910432 [Mycotypha africana]|uniref:uncharacterized protein n=1 Tax=Mycotypha africana TaxID=64632 RepID=UPI0023010853|nr:uncharacterized protein BDF20DRAFT_910432 [Mycotypha africana]KAI8987893.1 hypothetical protein BDF20DRAFT_910432 [Mycotypha africana]